MANVNLQFELPAVESVGGLMRFEPGSSLHRLIEYDLPPSPVRLLDTWKEMIAIARRQRKAPHYQYLASVRRSP